MTRSRIKQALISLIGETNYAGITITDISERANVNRATFYAHYRDKDQVLDEIVSMFLDGLMDKFDTPRTTDIFTHILEHVSLMKALLSDKHLKDRFHKQMSQALKRAYSERLTLLTANDEKMSSETEVYNTYAGSATLGMIEFWYKDDFRLSPAYMAEQITGIAAQRPHRYLDTLIYIERTIERKPKVSDRRIERTRLLLQNALLTLLREKSFGDITVQEISKRADVHRVTFYAHYNDKETLVEDITRKTLADLIEWMHDAIERKSRLSYARNECLSTLLAFFTFITTHSDLFYLALNDNKIPGFRAAMFDALQVYFARGLAKAHTQYSSIHPEIYSHYIASALLGVVDHWLSDGMRYSPSHMAEILTEIINKIPQKTIYHRSY